MKRLASLVLVATVALGGGLTHAFKPQPPAQDAGSVHCSMKQETGTCKKNGCLGGKVSAQGHNLRECRANVMKLASLCNYGKGKNPADPEDSCHYSQMELEKK